MMLNNEESAHLADLLRLELQEFGCLVGLLNKQQEMILQDDIDGLMEINQVIERQASITKMLQDRRKAVSEDFSAKLGIKPLKKMSQMLAVIPVEQQGMFESIVKEINSLVERIGVKMRQNRMLLIRLYNFSEKILSQLQPTDRVRTYTAQGSSRANTSVKGNAVTLTA